MTFVKAINSLGQDIIAISKFKIQIKRINTLFNLSHYFFLLNDVRSNSVAKTNAIFLIIVFLLRLDLWIPGGWGSYGSRPRVSRPRITILALLWPHGRPRAIIIINKKASEVLRIFFVPFYFFDFFNFYSQTRNLKLHLH